MDQTEVAEWFQEYLDVLAACGRGEQVAAALLGFCGVPLIVTMDEGVATFMSDDEVTAWAQQQVDGMLASGYDHSDVLDSEVIRLNATSALYRASYARVRGDGTEISRLAVTYLLTEQPEGKRISGLAVHSALLVASAGRA